MTKTTTYIFKDYNGEVIAEFSSLDEAATVLGVTRQTICNLVNGKVKRSASKGYSFPRFDYSIERWSSIERNWRNLARYV